MYLWRRSADPEWWRANEVELRALAGRTLAIIERPNRKRLQLQVAARSRGCAETLVRRFGGRIEKLTRNWFKGFVPQKTKPLRIRNARLIIPAGAAFGTGEHATTAMSLRFLERLTRKWKPGWSIVDLGTGSGIFALAAKRLGAARVIGIDSDPVAISTAKLNARLNKVRDVEFQVADVRKWKLPRKIDILTANLFSELLIEISPKLTAARWLILSGILREHERDVAGALNEHKIDVLEVRCRGKWVAILSRSHRSSD